MPVTPQRLTRQTTITLLNAFSQIVVSPGLLDDVGAAIAPTEAQASQGCECTISGLTVIVVNPTNQNLSNVVVRSTHQHSVELEDPQVTQTLAGPGTPIQDTLAFLSRGKELATLGPMAGPITAVDQAVPIAGVAGQQGLLDAGVITIAGNQVRINSPGVYQLKARANVTNPAGSGNDTFNMTVRRNPDGAPVVLATGTSQTPAVAGEQATMEIAAWAAPQVVTSADITGLTNNEFDVRMAKGGGDGDSGSLANGTLEIEKIG